MEYENRDKLTIKAKELRAKGLSHRKIADKLGVKGEGAIRLWLNPDIRISDNARFRQRYAENKEYRLGIRAKNKKSYIAHRKEDNARSREYYRTHKAKAHATSKQWVKDHPELVCEIKARYRETHREELREKNREYNAAHQVERTAYARYWRATNEERAKKAARQYYQSHRDQYRKYRLRRRGYLSPGGGIDQEQFAALFEKQEGLCAYCKKELLTKGNHLHPDYCNVEHIYPLSRNGIDGVENIVLACRGCNSEKGTRTIKEWRPELLSMVGNGVRNKE